MRKNIFILLFFTFVVTQVHSQAWSRYKYEGFYGAGPTNFMGDVPAATPEYTLGQYVVVNFFNTIGYAGNVGLRYNYDKNQYVTGNIFIGSMYGKDPVENPNYYDRGLEFRSFFTEITARYEVMIIKEKRKTTVYKMLGEKKLKNLSIPTYLFIGTGAIVSVGSFNEIVDDGARVKEEKYVNIAPTIPMGIGFKYKVNRLTYINLEISTRAALGDKLDYASGKEFGKFGKYIDQYQSITFNIVHKLRQSRSGMPKFSKRSY